MTWLLRLPTAPPDDAPATLANVRRNARAGGERPARWRPARDALWRLLDEHVSPGAAVAVAGAGNCDDLPLRRLLARAARVDLIDLDVDASRFARGRLPRKLRRRTAALEADVTGGLADRVALAIRDRRLPEPGAPQPLPLGRAPYDVVIGDLLYSQLLGPALADIGLDSGTTRRTLLRHGQSLTDAAVARLHESAPGGCIVHVHDPLVWREGCPQPFSLEEALARSAGDPHPERVLAGAHTAVACDPRRSVEARGTPILKTAWWHWPFASGVDYLVCATVAAAERPRPVRGRGNLPRFIERGDEN